MKVLYGLFFLAGFASVNCKSVESGNDDHIVAMMLEAEKFAKPNLTYVNLAELCYDEFGCFTRSVWGVFPETPDAIDPKFHLYTSNSKTATKIYSYNSNVGDEDEETKKLLQDATKKLVFIAHGFGGSGDVEWVEEIKEAKTKFYGHNVIVIDWATGARLSTFYVGAVANSVLMGRITARLCLNFVKNLNISLTNVEFVGFSLGAQMAGFFAQHIFETTGEKIGKITALDAAAPLFESNGIYPSKEHAILLEAVHTAAGALFWRGKVGVGTSFGHVDYYPNGGIDQPGCRFLQFACAHSRAVQYYIESLSKELHCYYKGFPCDSVEHANTGRCYPVMNGKYFLNMAKSVKHQAIIYLRTTDAAPFCMDGYRL